MTKLRRLVRSRVFWPLAAGAASFAFTVGLIAYANHGGKPKLRFDVELTEKACCLFQVWINGKGPNDVTSIDVKPGTRSTYSVPLHTQFVHYLQIALAGPSTVGDTVKIHRIWTERGDRTIDEITPEEFRAFGGSNVVLRPETQGLTVRTTDQYPYVVTGAGLVTDTGPRRLFFSALPSRGSVAVAAIILLGAALTLVFAIASWRHVLMVLGLAATLLVVRSLPWASWNLFQFRDDVSEAVGYAPYVGQWKTRDRAVLGLAALVAFVIPALVALGLSLAGRRQTSEPPAATASSTSQEPMSPRSAIALVAAPVFVLGLLGMPNLRALSSEGTSTEYVSRGDLNNLLFWQYLIRTTDLMPMKDFFYPYGFQWLFSEAPPWGELASYVVHLSFWLWLALGTYLVLSRFFRGRGLVLRYAIAMGFVLTVVLAGFAGFHERYIGPLGVVLLYAGIDPRDRLRSPKRVVFSIALAELLLFEIAQGIYALVPIAFLVLTELVLEARHTRSAIVGWLKRSTITVGLPVAAALAVYALTGTLSANVAYYGELDALQSAYAFPAAVDAWIEDPRSLESYVFWAVPLTIALGMVGLLLQRGHARNAQAAVVALGLLGFMVMQKQILRPHVAVAIWLVVLYGLVLWALLDTALHPVRRWMGIAATGGILFAVVLMSGQLRDGVNGLRTSPERTKGTISATLDGDKFESQARAEFAPARFRQFGYEEVVRNLRRDGAWGDGRPLWVLGDDPGLVIVLGESWPYYFHEVYDTSPIAFQKKVLSRLERTPPDRVVWNFGAVEFDAVPNVVRVPLLFDWAVRRLAPESEVGSYAILRPLRAGERPHLDWWRMRLGSTISLGHVPAASTVHGAPCTASESCETYLVLEHEGPTPPPPELAVPIRVANRAFEVRLATTFESSRYVVRLDRLWFWANAPPETVRRVDTGSLAGFSARLVRRTAELDTLY